MVKTGPGRKGLKRTENEDASPMRLRRKKIRVDGDSWLTKREGIFSPSHEAMMTSAVVPKSDLDDDATLHQESGAEQVPSPPLQTALGATQVSSTSSSSSSSSSGPGVVAPTEKKKGPKRSLLQEIKQSLTWRPFFVRLRDALRQISFEHTMLETYEREGWRSANLEKMRPEKELAAARRKVVAIKAKIHALLRDLMEGDDAKQEAALREPDDDGLSFEHILCSKCHGGDSNDETNDIVMCDLEGCNKAFHQDCCDPVISDEELKEDDDDWFCRRCTCMLEGLNEINAVFDTDFDDWREVYPPSFTMAELAKLDAAEAETIDAKRSRRSGRRIRKPKVAAKAAWDTHSFNSEGSSSDESFDTDDEEELDEAESDEEDDAMDAQESSLVLDFKRQRPKVDYRALAAQMFKDEGAQDSEKEEANDNSGPGPDAASKTRNKEKRKGRQSSGVKKDSDGNDDDKEEEEVDADYEDGKSYSSSAEASLRELYNDASSV
ncbi:Integrator complex subunit 12 [Hondaea fermentalgiana]|uniref:Integrator complex subunit 12 n=1 Tax=Hondaea fermentalgiana TaxID=2315210 RepID=A0A2R5G4R8_9STRA|nr:Integrator complex subunit 12 [Hondaea fermentalgiana]|eukprot:GBG25319.1 Integrator complex subunit 12 [Hondaea fermentalgiana]